MKSKVVEFDELLMSKMDGAGDESLRFAIQRLKEEREKLENPTKK